jgi:hypothetical protein
VDRDRPRRRDDGSTDQGSAACFSGQIVSRLTDWAHVRFGSVASNRYGAGGRGMSASPPIATKFMLGCERRDVPIAFQRAAAKTIANSITSLVTTRAMRRWRQEKKPSPKLVFSLSFFMGHNCLWRSHAYSLGLTFSVSHRGLFFWQREPFRKFQEQPRSLRD